jgi:hypothetical protein
LTAFASVQEYLEKQQQVRLQIAARQNSLNSAASSASALHPASEGRG